MDYFFLVFLLLICSNVDLLLVIFILDIVLFGKNRFIINVFYFSDAKKKNKLKSARSIFLGIH